MPAVLRVGPYRFYFYSHEPNEPPHIDRDSWSAKFWLEEVSLATNLGFSAKELRTLYSLVRKHQKILLEAWYGYFGNSS